MSDARPAAAAPVVILRSPYEVCLLIGSVAVGLPLLAGVVTSNVLAGVGVTPWVIRGWGMLLLALGGSALWAMWRNRPVVHRLVLLPLALACSAYALALLATSPRGYVAGAWIACHAAGHFGRWWQYVRTSRPRRARR